MTNTKSIQLIKEHDQLYEHYYDWLAGQYDVSSGGFYYARSAINQPEYQPDIESTAQGVKILLRSGLIEPMPIEMKDRIVAFFKERQQADGYFIDPHNEMRTVDRMVARAVGYCKNALDTLGAEADYALPGTGGVTSLPPHLLSLEVLEKWLDERPWDYAWMACDNISAAGVYIMNLPEETRQVYLDFVLDYLNRHQDSETGMWGEGRPYIKLSGAFKLCLFYRKFGLVMPRVNKIYDYVLYALRHDTSEDMCWTRNAVDLLTTILPDIPPIPEEILNEILTITYRNLKQYLKPDGGFSRHVAKSLKSPNNVPLGLGLVEGDMNAGTQALLIRALCHGLAGLDHEPIRRLTVDFYEKLEPSL